MAVAVEKEVRRNGGGVDMKIAQGVFLSSFKIVNLFKETIFFVLKKAMERSKQHKKFHLNKP